MTDLTDEQEREAFEMWATEEGCYPLGYTFAEYQDAFTQVAWEAWQARAVIAADRAEREGWRPIETAPEEVERYLPVDLWMDIPASALSMGQEDSFRVTDCWTDNGKWVHDHRGVVKALCDDYITHWMPLPAAPSPTQQKE